MDRLKSDTTSHPDLYHALNNEPALTGPDPGFVFPPREDVAAGASHESGQGGETEMKGSAKPPGVRSRPDRISISQLPPFSFPAPVTPPATQAQLGEQSPTRSIPISRTGGHRRGGSEFIGGDGSTGGPGLMSASPVKAEGALPSPSAAGRRRGHAHRRSGAISNHDLSNILRPADPNRLMSGSAPTTPSPAGGPFPERPILGHASSQPTLPRPVDSPPRRVDDPTENEAQSEPPAAVPRPRVVGFSDKLEYIPRPLSTISSATSSSMSTIRPAHSLTGSITSIPSLVTSSPPSARKLDHFRSPSLGSGELLSSSVFDGESGPSKLSQRPRTPLRGLSLDSDQTRNMASESGPATGSEQEESSTAAVQLSPSVFSELSTMSLTRPGFPRISSPHNPRRIELPRPRSSPEAKVSKPTKKGKPWTGILSRRSRQHDAADSPALLAVTAPPRSFLAPAGEAFDPNNFDFGNDPTRVIRNPTYVPPLSAPAYKTRTFRRSESSDEDEDVRGVLDLDATWRLQEAEAKASRAAAATKRLHSSGATGGFLGPGMHYHRRAESAPALTPFENPFSAKRAGGGSPQMADVFEEDEGEDGGLAARTTRSVSRESSRSKASTFEPKRGNKAEASANPFSASEQGYRAVDAEAANTLGTPGTVAAEEAKSPHSPPSTLAKQSSDDSTSTTTPTMAKTTTNATPTLEPTRSTPTPTIAPQTLTYIPDLSGMAAEPSPEHAQTSFDNPRLHTANSSVTERSAYSSARDSGPAYSSVDDVPSLTSTASTHTGAGPMPHSPHAPQSRGSGFAAGVDDTSSASGATARAKSVSDLGAMMPGGAGAGGRESPRPTSRARKRASLASLSRLVSGSFGEKSKLSIESRAEDEGAEGGGSARKRKNRMSRLMHFFKSKENPRGAARGGESAEN